MVSSTLLGAAVGSFTGGGFADALGRRKAFMLCAVPMLVGPLLSAFASDLNTMVAGRFLAGLAIGLSSALVPLYVSEVSRHGPAATPLGLQQPLSTWTPAYNPHGYCAHTYEWSTCTTAAGQCMVHCPTPNKGQLRRWLCTRASPFTHSATEVLWHGHAGTALHLLQVSPTAQRGALGSLNQLMICLGILGALCINVVLPVTDWRLMFKVAAIPAAILFLGEALVGTETCNNICSSSPKLWQQQQVAQRAASQPTPDHLQQPYQDSPLCMTAVQVVQTVHAQHSSHVHAQHTPQQVHLLTLC